MLDLTKPDFLMASAMISIREKSLLSQEKIKRMLDSADFSGAVKVLYESGYGGGKIYADDEYGKLLNTEITALLDLFFSHSADETVNALFFSPYLYHNAKALYKSRWVNVNKEDTLYVSKGIQDISDDVKNYRYGALPAELADALQRLDTLFADRPPNPSTIDSFIDKEMQKNKLRILKNVKNVGIRNYYLCDIAFSNIFARLRGDAIGLKAAEIEPLLLPDTDETECLAALSKVLPDIAAAEKARDVFLLKKAGENKGDYDKINPLFSYAQIKLNEIQTVKIILSGKYNRLDKAVIAQKMRYAYAERK
jgi:V/A-type H+-transporting ATPase subunit C